MALIPKKFKIGYTEYQLEGISRELADQLEISGQIDYNNEKILYNKESKKIELFNTLLHESLHGIFNFHNTKFKNDAAEEVIVHTIANGLTMFLLDNPEFVTYLIETFDPNKPKK